MDALYLAGEDATHVVRDCIDPTRVGVLQLAPTYTPLEGVTFNGTSQYMQSGFNPADDADNMTPTSFSFGVYERVTSEAFTGHGAGSDGSFRLLPFFNTDTARAYLNSGGSTFKDCGGSSGLGLTVLQRNGSANNIYQNGSALSEEIAPTLESDDFASIEVLIGALPGPSGYRSCQVPAAFLADGTLDQSAVATELEAYLDALGVGVIA